MFFLKAVREPMSVGVGFRFWFGSLLPPRYLHHTALRGQGWAVAEEDAIEN